VAAGHPAPDLLNLTIVHNESPTTRVPPRALIGAVHIDRLNLGPVPTTELNWLQPYVGNIIDFFFRVWVCRLAMMVLPIYTHDQGAGV